MNELLAGAVLLVAGLGCLWALHVRERSGAPRNQATGRFSPLIRYLMFGGGWVCGLTAVVLGAAILVFAYADLSSG